MINFAISFKLFSFNPIFYPDKFFLRKKLLIIPYFSFLNNYILLFSFFFSLNTSKVILFVKTIISTKRKNSLGLTTSSITILQHLYDEDRILNNSKQPPTI